jgi:DNA repair exonuclease SbcCD ATPase subunit
MWTPFITILVVLFILFVFRRLDRNNLRLNKVKIFIDRQLERLEENDRRKREEIQVQESALNDLINRAETVNRSIDAKMESFAEKEEKIRRAEGLIAETEKHVDALLSRMAKADKDLAWLKEEAQHVASTGEQIKALRQGMEKLTKDVRERELKLTAEVQERHKSVNDAFLAKIDSLKNQVILTESKLAEKLNLENSNMTGVIKRIKDTFSFSEKNMQDQLRKLKEQVPAFLKQITEEFREQKDTLFQDSLDKIHRFNEVVKGIEATHLDNKHLLIDGFKANIADLEGQIDAAKSRFNEEISAVQRSTLERIASFQTVIDRQEEDYQRTREKHLGEVQSSLHEINAAVAKAKGEFEAIRKDSKTRFDQNFGQLQRKFEDKIDSYTVQSKELFAKLNEEKKKITAGINDKITELNQKSAETLKLVNSAEKNIQGAINGLIKGTQDSLARVEKEARSRHVQNADDVYARLSQDVDKKLALFSETMERNLAQINLAAETVEKKFLEEQQSNLEEMRSQYGKLQSDMSGFNLKFTDQEASLLQALRSKVENLDKEYAVKLKILEKQYTDFEAKVSKNITKDISEFQTKLSSAMTRYDKSAEELLRETKAKVISVEAMLKQLETKIAGTEKDYAGRLDDKLKTMDGSIEQRMSVFQELINEREKKVVEKLKTDVDRANENIRRLEGLLRENEERVRKSSKEMLSSFSEFLERHKSQADRSAEEFRKANEQRIDETAAHFAARLKATDVQLDRIIDDQKKKIQDRAFKLREEFAKIKETARADVQAFITEFSDKLGDLSKTYSALEQKSKNIEKTFLETIQGQVEGFSREIMERINAFRGELKLTEKNSSLKMSEFIQKLDQDYQAAKAKVFEQTDGVIKAQYGRVEEIDGRIAKLQKEMDYFLKQTKIFENADKLKDQIKKDIDTFNSGIAKIRDERQYLDKVDRRLESIRKNEDAIEKTLESLQNDRRNVEKIDAQVKAVKAEIDEMDSRLNQFGKDKEQIADIQQKFRSLDRLVEKVNGSLSQFAGREADLKRYSGVIEAIDKNYTTLERRSDSQTSSLQEISDRSEELKDRIDKLERQSMELSAKEEDHSRTVKSLGEIGAMINFVDTKAQQVTTLRNWATKAEEELKHHIQAGDEKVKELRHLLDEATRMTVSASAPRPSRPAEREQERPAPVREEADAETRIVGLKQNGWSAQQISKQLNVPLRDVLEILRRHSL